MMIMFVNVEFVTSIENVTTHRTTVPETFGEVHRLQVVDDVMLEAERFATHGTPILAERTVDDLDVILQGQSWISTIA